MASYSPVLDSKLQIIEGIAAPLLDAIFSQAPVGLTLAVGPDVEILRVSNYGSELLGKSRDALEHITADRHVEAYRVYDARSREPADADRLPLTRATRDGETVQGEEWLIGAEDGRLVPVLCNAGPIRDGNGQVVGGLIAWADLSRQKELEVQLRAALADRDAARAELHHRVKNHLALIAAMVRLHARDRSDDAKNIAETVSERITALGHAYSALEGRQTNAAPAADLLQAVAAPLGTPSVAIEIDTDMEVEIPAAQCGALGIMVNEAICNALKHGFPGGRAGTIQVSLKADHDCMELVVANDGLPLVANARPTGTGTRFTASLVRQLGGTMKLADNGVTGAKLTVRIPRSQAS